MAKEKFSLYLSDDIAEYVRKQADIYGMSVNAYVNLCIVEKRQALENMQTLSMMMNKMQDFQQMELKEVYK